MFYLKWGKGAHRPWFPASSCSSQPRLTLKVFTSVYIFMTWVISAPTALGSDTPPWAPLPHMVQMHHMPAGVWQSSLPRFHPLRLGRLEPSSSGRGFSALSRSLACRCWLTVRPLRDSQAVLKQKGGTKGDAGYFMKSLLIGSLHRD